MTEQEQNEKPDRSSSDEAAVDPKMPSESPASEVPADKESKGQPKGRRRPWMIALVAVLVLAAAVAGSYWAYQTVTERRAAVEDLTRATQLVEDADVVVIEVDDIVRTPIEVSVGVRAEAAPETQTPCGVPST